MDEERRRAADEFLFPYSPIYALREKYLKGKLIKARAKELEVSNKGEIRYIPAGSSKSAD